MIQKQARLAPISPESQSRTSSTPVGAYFFDQEIVIGTFSIPHRLTPHEDTEFIAAIECGLQTRVIMKKSFPPSQSNKAQQEA